MTRDEIIKLVNKGRITVTGLPNSERIQKMTLEEFAKKFITAPGLPQEIIEESKADDETQDNPDDEVKTVDEWIAEITAGGDVVLTEDLEMTSVVKPVANLNLDLGNNKITAVAGSDFMDVTKGVEATVKNGEIYEALGAKDNAEAVFYLSGATKDKLTLENVKATGARIVYLNNANDECLIKSGEYTVLYNSTPAVYVQGGGKAVIEGGVFKTDGNVANKYLLNLKDALLKDNAAAKATDYIEVRGGTFVNFDPSRSDSENPQADFVPAGYIVGNYTVGDVVKYVVEKYNDQPATDANGPEGAVINWDIDGYKKRSGIVEEESVDAETLKTATPISVDPVETTTTSKRKTKKATE